jgi:hypothetical protein
VGNSAHKECDMTSISSTMSTLSFMSPNDRMKLQLQSAVSAGTIGASDQSALSSALDDIDSAMQSSGPPAPGTSPSGMKDRIDSLIDNEVSDGKLTDDQAAELKKLFADAAPQGPGAPASADTAGSTGQGCSTVSSGEGSSTASTDDTAQMLQALTTFLEKFEKALGGNAAYTADGSSATSGRSAVLFQGNA